MFLLHVSSVIKSQLARKQFSSSIRVRQLAFPLENRQEQTIFFLRQVNFKANLEQSNRFALLPPHLQEAYTHFSFICFSTRRPNDIPGTPRKREAYDSTML